MATASLLPPARSVFYDPNGRPLEGGFVYTYVPGGTTPATTWQDAAETKPNSNPILLDSAGSCLLYGSGAYQLTVTDRYGNAVPAYSGVTSDAAAQAGISAAMLPFVRSTTVLAASNLLQYQATGTSSVQRSIANKLGEILSVRDFGAVGDGVTDDTAAIQAGISAAMAAQCALYLPAGDYLITAALTASLTDTQFFSLWGSGRGNTFIRLQGSAITALQLEFNGVANAFDISNLTFVTNQLGVATAVTVLQNALSESGPGNSSTYTNVSFRGSDSFGTFGTEYWIACIAMTNVAYVNYISCDFWGATGTSFGNGTAVALLGTNNTDQSAVVHNFTGCNWNGFTVCLLIGQCVQGVTISQCNMIGGNNGIVVAASSGPTQVQIQLTVSCSEFNVTGNAIQILGDMSDITIVNNLFLTDNLSPSRSAISFVNGQRISISGNSFVALGGATFTFGISVTANDPGNNGVITGNSFVGYNIGISLSASSSGWNVQSNSYAQCTTNTVNAGTNNTVGGGSP